MAVCCHHHWKQPRSSVLVMVEERLPTSHFLVLNQCNGWACASDSDADTHTHIRVMHIHIFLHKEALSCDDLCSGYTSPFLCHVEDEWAKISHSFSMHAWWSSIHLASVQLSWTVQWSSNGLNTTSQMSSTVHLFYVLLCMTEDPHSAPFIMRWTSSHQRDLMLPGSFSSEIPQCWQSDWIIWNGEWQLCFQQNTGALLIYVTEEGEWSFWIWLLYFACFVCLYISLLLYMIVFCFLFLWIKQVTAV